VARLDGDINGFPQTQWSLVRRAGAGNGTARGGGDHLDVLLRRYLPALSTYLRCQLRIAAGEADDLLQSFVAEKVVQYNLIARADQGRGRFRTFLLCTLRNYVLQRRRDEGAACRSPDRGPPMALSDTPDMATGDAGPSEQFDIAWARETVAAATGRMRAECERAGRADVWTIFDERVVRPAFEGVAPAAYEELVGRLGLATPLQACNLLTTGKRMFARCLREVVGEYAGDGASSADPEQEIADLRAILASGASHSGGRAESD
jgi:RNA polymerase sigma-70 factor (ECF subfamily)